MKREQKITLGGSRDCCRQGENSPGQALAFGRRRAIIAAMAASVLLPIEVSDAGWLSDVFKGSSKPGKSPKHVASPKRVASAKRAARRSLRIAEARTRKACRPGAGRLASPP